jgi:PAS domain S-box-containing protein
LPLLLWAAVRFGVNGVCLSILVTAYMVFLDASGGEGPFTTKSPAENVLSLQLFLITISLPLIFLAGLISERRDKESALRESEARYRALVMASANMVWRANAKGEGFFVSPGWHDLTGQSEDEASNLGWLKALHPKDQERSKQLWKQAMTQKRMYENEFRVRTRDGSYRHFHVQAVPIVALDSRVHEWVGAAVDITDRKEAALEAQRHRDELAHVARISTMGELAASLAHELNQPLTAIRSNAQAAQRFLAANPADLGEVRDILRDIVDDNSRASEVIRRLRELAKKGNIEVAALDLPALVRDVVLLIHSDAILHNVNVVLEMNPGVPQIQGDKVQLQQVILNLLLNAFQAMKDCPVNERQVTIRTELDDPMAIIAVRDHGVGLSGEQLEKIFQPFYTTKDNGLGMGLAISRSIVEAHGGRLWAQNSPDRGATFHFTVPVGKNDEAVMNKEGDPKVRPASAPI